MGMDVMGTAPASDAGKYFRNNVWWWHPLWDFCEKVAPDLIALDNDGHTNDGWGLDDELARALGQRLQALLDDGTVAAYATAREARIAALPDARCELCAGTGGRLRPPACGAGPLRCNGCAGTGHHRPTDTYYTFDQLNVEQFVAFLATCGGFRIC